MKKKYKVNTAWKVGTTNSGIKWRYNGKKEKAEYEEMIEEVKTGRFTPAVGIRITDLETNEIIYEFIK